MKMRSWGRYGVGCLPYMPNNRASSKVIPNRRPTTKVLKMCIEARRAIGMFDDDRVAVTRSNTIRRNRNYDAIGCGSNLRPEGCRDVDALMLFRATRLQMPRLMKMSRKTALLHQASIWTYYEVEFVRAWGELRKIRGSACSEHLDRGGPVEQATRHSR